MSAVNDAKLLWQHPNIIIATTTANWNSGVATSGLAGADLVTIGGANQWYRLNSGWVITSGFNIAATVTIREYCNIAGANRLVMTDDWTMPEELINLSWFLDAELFGPYRIELYSDQAADDGLAVPYEYRMKEW